MRYRLTLLISVIAMLSFVACAGTLYVKPTQDEINAYMAQRNIPDFDKECLLNGEYKVGMQASTLRFMMGDPKEIKVEKKPWATQEVWYYKKSGKKWFTIEDNGVVGIEAE